MAEPPPDAAGYVVLMYHEIERAGRPLADASRGYRRYAVPESEFLEQLALIRECGLRGAALSPLLADGGAGRIGISFDDGCATDRSVAADALRGAGFGATFFIVPGFLGRPGYLAPSQVRELSDAGFEIGSHSMLHHFLTALPPAELEQDLLRSRQELETLCGRAVPVLSCPGGRWSPAVAAAARGAGYQAVATSRPALNSAASDRYRLGRLAIRRGTGPGRFRRWCGGRGLAAERARGALLVGVRSLLGNSLYHSLHRRLAR